jgi:hypothetical protein
MKCKRPECNGNIIIELNPEEELSISSCEGDHIGYLTLKGTCDKCLTSYIAVLYGPVVVSHMIDGDNIILIL